MAATWQVTPAASECLQQQVQTSYVPQKQLFGPQHLYIVVAYMIYSGIAAKEPVTQAAGAYASLVGIVVFGLC